MESSSIIGNELFTGDGYVKILDSDVAVKISGVELEKIDIKKLEPNIQKEATDGIYLVGYDLAHGLYKVEFQKPLILPHSFEYRFEVYTL